MANKLYPLIRIRLEYVFIVTYFCSHLDEVTLGTSGVTTSESVPLQAASSGAELHPAALELPEEMIQSTAEVNTKLKNIADALLSMNQTWKELVKK